MKRRGCGICGGILLALAAALIGGIVWFIRLDPPVGAERRTGAENYGRYNGYVEAYIRDELHGLLPDVLPEGTQANYESCYHCALLGDPAFAATLELTFDDAALYARERARLEGLAERLGAARSEVCFLAGSREVLAAAVDEDIRDGMAYELALFRLDDAARRISYCAALIWDAQGATEEYRMVERFLRGEEGA